MLAELRLRAGDTREALDLAKRATTNQDAPTSAWIVLAVAQRASGDKIAAKTILDRLLAESPTNLAVLLERADLLIDEKNYEAATGDLQLALKQKSGDKTIMTRLAFVYQQAGKHEEAAAMAKAAGIEVQQQTNDGTIKVIGTPEEIEAANSTDPTIARKALEKLIEKNPRNGMLLGKLGASYRTDDPARSLELFRRASELQPEAPEYALGYAAALVQARRFPEAAYVLQRVVKASPQNYVAHANLATALYESKRYGEALPETMDLFYPTRWWLTILLPHRTIIGEYVEALSAYERFLVALTKLNRQEIDKVKLKLPSLRDRFS